jgi:hypothetical protein
MIEIPRGLARQFRAVLRRAALAGEPRGPWPLLLCRIDRNGLTLQAGSGNVAVRYRSEGERPPAALAFRASLLAEFEGRGDAMVALSEAGPGTGRARWDDGAVPRVLEFDTVTPDSVPPLPPEPKEYVPVPEGFLRALAEAAQSTSREPGRLGLSRVQLRGRRGQVVATDGKQLLVQGGFPLPWPEDLLVSRLPVFGFRDVALEGPAGIGRTSDHVGLRVGPWTFLLRIDKDSRFPDVEAVIPRPGQAASRLRLDPADAAFLAGSLPRLPSRDEHYSPVTLDLGPAVAVRARAEGRGPATELVLPRSAALGKPVRLCTDRRYVLRAVQLGFAEIEVTGPDRPVTCRDTTRAFVWMPLDKAGVIPPGADAVRVTPPGEETPKRPPPPERRTVPVPTPSPNGRVPDAPQPPDRGGLNELLAEAEALRTLLADASARATRLLAALKQHRRQARAVEAAVSSLRQLRLGP